MAKTLAQQRKEANAAPKYVLANNQFGHDIYIADKSKTDDLITLAVDEALQFSVGFDEEETKLQAWSISTGLDLKVVYL